MYKICMSLHKRSNHNTLSEEQFNSSVNTMEIARPLVKRGKALAIEQLTVAENFLSEGRNNALALEIYKVFFGSHQGEEKLIIWQKKIKQVLEGIKALDTKINISYNYECILLPGRKDNVVMEADCNAFNRRDKVFFYVYARNLEAISKRESLGQDHLAHIIIHEFSHLVLDTKDYAYIDVTSNDGNQDLRRMLGLLNPESAMNETDRQRRFRGGEEAVQNADSFTTATRYLAYSAKNPAFASEFRNKKNNYTSGAPFLIGSPHWNKVN